MIPGGSEKIVFRTDPKYIAVCCRRYLVSLNNYKNITEKIGNGHVCKRRYTVFQKELEERLKRSKKYINLQLSNCFDPNITMMFKLLLASMHSTLVEIRGSIAICTANLPKEHKKNTSYLVSQIVGKSLSVVFHPPSSYPESPDEKINISDSKNMASDPDPESTENIPKKKNRRNLSTANNTFA